MEGGVFGFSFYNINITRTELWNRGGDTMLIHYSASGASERDFTLRRQIDPDMDSPGTSHTEFYENTDYDLYLSATGPHSGWTVGWGACNSDGRVGTIDSLSAVDEDSGVCRSDGMTADMMLTYIWDDTTASGSESVTNAFVMTSGASPSSAESRWTSNQVDMCGDLHDHSWPYSWATECSPLSGHVLDPPDMPGLDLGW
jgi:hypothetical protein